MTPTEVLIQQLINGLMVGILYALIGVGFTLYFGVLDVINFAHGDVFMLGAFMALVLLPVVGVIPYTWLVVLLLFIGAMILTSVVGVVTERLFVKPVSRAPMLISLLVTLGLGISIREAVRLFYPRGADPKFFPKLLPDGGFDIGNVFLRYDNIIIFLLGVGIIIVVNLFITRTKMGSAIRAVAQDREAAMMMGVDVNRTVDLTFIIGSALAAMAGVMYGFYYGQVMFNIGAMAGVIGFSVAVIGGLGNVYGAIVGGFLFGLLETLAAAVLPWISTTLTALATNTLFTDFVSALPLGTENKRVIAFLVVILFLVFKPTGILGEKVYERV
jgi:branched-chain amino acid transport system permease protein